MVVKQGYLVAVGVIVAHIFTWIPEWSTWVVHYLKPISAIRSRSSLQLLVFMSIYDICAVLIPGGPLKVTQTDIQMFCTLAIFSFQALVELAIERGEDIPALVYEVRPTVRPESFSRKT